MAAIPVTYRPEVELRLRELAVNGTNYVGIKAPTILAGNVVWSLPNADGTAGYALVTNGAGALSFAISGTGLLAANNTWTGAQDFTNATTSTSPSTGALVVLGGAGVGADIFGGGRIVSVSPSLGVGYSVGAGGSVTQITSSATPVGINKVCGQITTVALTTAAAAEEVFNVTNNVVGAADVVLVATTYAGAGTPAVTVKNVTTAGFDIVITNLHSANALNAVVVINFAVIKSSVT